MIRRLLKIFAIFLIIISMGILAGCITLNISRVGESENTTAAAATPEPVLTPAPVPSEPPARIEPSGTPVPVQVQITPDAAEKKQNRKVFPILYYHAVNDKINGIEELFVSPGEFEKQMEYIKKNNYQVITFDDLEDINKYDKPIIITLDDGYEDNYTYAYPILKKYNFKATIFQVVDFIGKPLILNESQINEMSDLINFQSHTLTHPYLTQISPEEAEKEIAQSKKILQDLTGKPVNAFAYPIGDYNRKVLEMVKKHYKYAVCNGGGLYTVGDSFYEMKRVYVPRQLDIKGFEKKIHGLQ